MKKHRKVYYKCLAGKRKSIEGELPTKIYKAKPQCLNQEVWEALELLANLHSYRRI